MSELTERDAQLEIVHASPYPQLIEEGPGRWFTTDHGTVWTNDDNGLGFLPSDTTNAQIEQLDARKSLSAAGLSATEAFSELLDQESDNNPGVTPTQGDLSELLSTGKNQIVDEYGITLDDSDNVLELVKTNSSGVFIYDAGQWVALDPDAEDNEDDTVYGREWVDVSPEIIPFFDTHANDDVINRAQIEPFIV